MNRVADKMVQTFVLTLDIPDNRSLTISMKKQKVVDTSFGTDESINTSGIITTTPGSLVMVLV